METVQTRLASVYETLKGDYGYKNAHQAAGIEKVVISVGTGRIEDKAKIALIQDRLAQITGQKAAPRAARLSIAAFKLREGDIVGYQVTLRGKRMFHFLDKLIHVALPQTRDFRGLKTTSVDEMGNYTLGIKEHTIFPETVDEDIKDVFGMSITFVTTATTKEEAKALLRHIGLPLKKEEEVVKKKK
jgi:large subunit ribosomal protein L5